LFDIVVLCMYVDLGKMSPELRMKSRGCPAQIENMSTGFGVYTPSCRQVVHGRGEDPTGPSLFDRFGQWQPNLPTGYGVQLAIGFSPLCVGLID